MPRKREFSAEDKAAVVMRHLIDQVPISEICEQSQIKANTFYRWQAEFKQNAAAAFRKPDMRKQKAEQRKVEQLEGQLKQKDEIIAYVTSELMQSKKKSGEI